jgi:serine/threonine protein phosphatase PrpC
MTEFIMDRALLTDVGRKRRHNEDSVGHFEPVDPEELASSGRLYIVADGVGGGAAGEVASEYAVKKVLHEYYRSSQPDLGERLKSAARAANADLFEHVEQHPELGRMGTTIVAAAIHGDQLVICNVGDSRAYLIRSGEIRQITHDHSLVANLVEEGSITPEEAKTHPKRNIVLRTLGVDPIAHPDIFEGRLQSDDRIVLCSDGLTRHVSDDEIMAEAVQSQPHGAVRKLVDMANIRGGRDNISVAVLHITEPVPLQVLVERMTGEGSLEAPEFDDLHDTAKQRRRVTVPAPSSRSWSRLVATDAAVWMALIDALLWLLLLYIVSIRYEWSRFWPWLAIGCGAVIVFAIGVVIMRLVQIKKMASP